MFAPDNRLPRIAMLALVAIARIVALPTVEAVADDAEKHEWKYSPELLRPFWLGDTVQGESVLFIRDEAGGGARAQLLFPVTKVLAVRNSAQETTYEEGRDYTWKPGSREIVLPPGSRITASLPQDMRRPAKSQKYELTHRDGNGEIFFGGLLEYHALQTSVTYSHGPVEWKAATPKFAAKQLPRTIARLKEHKPTTIVLLGDSISSGCNASGWGGGPPYQPPFQDLFRQHLAESYKAPVELKNLSVGGRDSAFGLTLADKVAAEKPDLVILAFGMNDSAGRPAKEFQGFIEQTMAKVHETVPECEFILVATMLGNRDWVRLKHELFPEYRDALATLVGPGVALADLTSLWTAMFEHKKDWDLTGNGVNHPNDFGHRIYASVLSALLIPETK